MCFILKFVHWQVVAGIFCNAECICSRHQCCLNLTWKGLGITLKTLSRWFDLVLGSDVTM